MSVIIGIIVVVAAIVGGYLLEHGNLLVLLQPAELLIIGGAALGTLFIANPIRTLVQVFKGILGAFAGSRYKEAFYLENLRMLYELFNLGRKGGMAKLEADVEEPEKSELFKKYPGFLKNHHARDFLCDTLRLAISGADEPFLLDQMMEMDSEIHHHEREQPVAALTTMADSLPGLGIVAAVLGVVVTMGSLGGPPEEVGHKVAAALVGTFLGILLCYGFFGPLASNMAKRGEEEHQYYQTLRIGLVAYIRGSAPILAIEFARRSIPYPVRPSFKEMEKVIRGGAEKQAAAA